MKISADSQRRRKFKQILNSTPFIKGLLKWLGKKREVDILNDNRWLYIIEQREPNLVMKDIDIYCIAFLKVAKNWELVSPTRTVERRKYIRKCLSREQFREEMFIFIADIQTTMTDEINKALLADIITEI
jgi:hypothetical protein